MRIREYVGYYCDKCGKHFQKPPNLIKIIISKNDWYIKQFCQNCLNFKKEEVEE